LSDKDLVALKAQVASYDKQIIAVFKELKRANDTGNIMKLNEVIANRPDMSNYSTTAEYLDAFNQYVREAEKILEESNREFQTNLAQGVHEHIDNNTTELENLTVAVGGAVIENDNLNFAQLEKDIEDGTAQIIKEVKLEGGKTRVTIRNAKGEIIGAVRTAERHIIRDVDSQGAQIRKTIEEDGNKTRVAIKQDGDDTRNVIQERADETNELVKEDIAIGIDNLQETKAEADRIISTLDPTGLKRVMSWLRDQALNAGQSVGDFIKNNPTLPMSPVLGAPGLTLGAIAGGLLKKMEQQ
jgi:metal-dependent amidase/aminoacylase/carboxypeptidase family protein